MDDALRQRIARIARWNGGSIAVVAGLGALFSSAGGAWVAAGFAAAIAVAGWLERDGGKRLAALAQGSAGDLAALGTRLVRCELAVLAGIFMYSMWRLATADVAAELGQLPEAERELLASLTAGDQALLEQMFQLALKITYGTLIIVTLVYQGGMAWWYGRTLRGTA